MMKFSASAFVLLICTAALLSTTEGRPRMRCKCILSAIKTYSQPEIDIEEITSLEVIGAGTHCRYEVIIATTKKGKQCLSATDNWVISLKKHEKFNKKSLKSQP